MSDSSAPPAPRTRLRLADFDYTLPTAAVAQEPLAERDASRLLVLNRETGRRSHHTFRDLPDLLAPGDLVVVNRSRVVPARLIGQRRGGGRTEVFLLRRVPGGAWEAFVRPGRRLRPGAVVRVAPELLVRVESEALAPDGRRRVRLDARGDEQHLIATHGRTPLPPYIRRAPRRDDRDRYQTVFAREPGSVAAPTAGLHFTDTLRGRLADRGIAWAEVLLHVGPATFQPVTTELVEEHRVAAEPFLVPEETADAVRRTRERGRRTVCVGTTTVRTLESAAAHDGQLRPGAGETDLVVVPGYRFRVTDALVTNFHLPRSSLLLLVSAYAGRDHVLAAYAEALASGYRFYSYGDAMLVL